MAIQTQTESEFTMNNVDTHNWHVPRGGYYRVKVGKGGSPNFAAATIAVTQDGNGVVDNFGSAAFAATAAYADAIIHLVGGQDLTFTPSGAVTTVIVGISPV